MWLFVAFVGLSLVYAFFHFRDFLVGADLGAHAWLITPAWVVILIGFYLDWVRRKHLTTRILVGSPELEGDASNLLTEGLYAHLRHPRYLALIIAYLGYALFANFSGVYIYFAASMPLLGFIIWLEERELYERFGQAYRDYASKTPCILPKLF